MHKKTLKKAPWPTKKAMVQIYDQQLWGGTSAHSFYSGSGSHEPQILEPYLKAAASFLKSFTHPLSVCDLGCGDFNVGKHLVGLSSRYHAIDIVPELIAYNQKTYTTAHLQFHCLDIAKDVLPIGDCAMLRQVLQHLSNAEILQILKNLNSFKYLILTEHIPAGTFQSNIDIISGQGTRLKKQSGLDITAAPFHFKYLSKKELVHTTPKNGKGIIVTTLYTQ